MTCIKHFFIINPEAGKIDASEKLSYEIQKAFEDTISNKIFKAYIKIN